VWQDLRKVKVVLSTSKSGRQCQVVVGQYIRILNRRQQAGRQCRVAGICALSLPKAVSYCTTCYGIARSIELHIEINKQLGMAGIWAPSMYSLPSITIRPAVPCGRYLRSIDVFSIASKSSILLCSVLWHRQVNGIAY